MNTQQEYALTSHWEDFKTGEVKQITEARFKENNFSFASDTFERCAIHSSYKSDGMWLAFKYTLKKVNVGTDDGEIIKEYLINSSGKCVLNSEEVNPVTKQKPILKPKSVINPSELASQIVGCDILKKRGFFHVTSAKVLSLRDGVKIEARCQVVTHKLCADNLVNGTQAMGENVFILSLDEAEKLMESSKRKEEPVNTGSFYQWYEVYREEGYEPDQAESRAERSAKSNQPLPSWYVNPIPVTYNSSDIPEDCPF
jgi:hypothetical protein